jgi:hypothetical protein
MASRFVVGDNHVIEDLKTSTENSNTTEKKYRLMGWSV